VVRDLGSAAPSLARLIKGQGELADSGRQSFPSLGDALERGRPALIGSRPLIRNLGRFAKDADPTTKSLDELTTSLAKTGGPERIMDFLYYAATSTNGFDAIGHYLRAGLITNTCSNFTLSLSPGCNATFYDTATSSSTAAANATAPTALGGAAAGVSAAPPLQQLAAIDGTPAQQREREANRARLRAQATQPSPGLGASEAALDYLLGGGE
jgi:phospholipid/cholesterol/gamma-HCH transport system substrate-binding protein